MKRYLLFTYNFYYPEGGWKDFRGSFDTKKEAHIFMKTDEYQLDYYNLVDIQTGEVEEDRCPDLTRYEQGL